MMFHSAPSEKPTRSTASLAFFSLQRSRYLKSSTVNQPAASSFFISSSSNLLWTLIFPDSSVTQPSWYPVTAPDDWLRSSRWRPFESTAILSGDDGRFSQNTSFVPTSLCWPRLRLDPQRSIATKIAVKLYGVLLTFNQSTRSYSEAGQGLILHSGPICEAHTDHRKLGHPVLGVETMLVSLATA
jgi:hypothetical protein